MTQSVSSILRFVTAAATIGAFFVTSTALAESNRVISVEEHWELQLGQPDTDRSAPQTTMVMSPIASVDGAHFLFTLNHANAPDYRPGGMQVQFWNGEDLVDEHQWHSSSALEFENETVHWTQKLSLHDGTLTFSVENGESQTWGQFGGEELSVSTPTDLTFLNSYRPSVSLSESQVNYAENRVGSLTLTKLVWVTEDGQVHEQNAPIPIDITLGDE
jgi:hypothetical protein